METLTIFKLSIQQLILLAIFVVSFLIQMAYYLIYIRKFIFHKPNKGHSQNQAVSVIITSKNQGKYLEENLPYFLEQAYSNYEVIVVNDCSKDETETIITKLQANYPHLRYSHIPTDEKFQHNKKLALSIGIKAAKNDTLLFSDPYCRPASRHWLEEMQQHFPGDKKLVLGYSNIPQKKGFLNRLIRYDLLFNTIKRNSLALKGKFYSGDGTNIGYRQRAFFANKGFSGHTHMEAGYDHLMAHQLGSDNNVNICYSAISKIENHHEAPFQFWMQFNRNYFHSRKQYPFSLRLVLDIEPISRFFFHATFFFLLIPGPLLLISGLLMGLRIILFGSYMKIASSNLKEGKLFLSSYINDILVLFIKLYIFATNRFVGKDKRWK